MNNTDNDNYNININFLIQEKECANDTAQDGVCDITAINSDLYSLSSESSVFGHFEDLYDIDCKHLDELFPFDLPYYINRDKYDGNDELFYDTEYTVSGLMKICEYYKIDKDVKKSKCKKHDIISTIIFFESLDENQYIVIKRHKMWAYMDVLSKDEHMRKYIIWT